jgi:hypothetical protein
MNSTNIIEKVLFPTFIVTATLGTYNVDLPNSIPNKSEYKIPSNTKLFSELQPSYGNYIDMGTLQHLNKVNTISDFANNLLSNSVDLKKEISNMVDEEFWDLI